jgi:hypothetical protein
VLVGRDDRDYIGSAVSSVKERDVPLTTDKSVPKKPRKKHANPSHTVRAAHKAHQAVSEERLFHPGGHRGRVLTLDANSATFTSDLTVMFEKNVARARRKHKRKADSAGRAR